MWTPVGDQILLEVKGFDFCPNLIKFYAIYTNLPKFYPYPNSPKFCLNLPKKLLGMRTHLLYPQLLYATGFCHKTKIDFVHLQSDIV